MKTSVAIALVVGLANGAFAQGLVLFFNNSTTLISVGTPGNAVPISGPVGSYYFALLTAPAGTSDPTQFTFSGAYATNQSTAGRITGGMVTIDGWIAGTVRAFEVAGWSSQLGTAYQSSWLTSRSPGFGLSGIGSGSPGGYNPDTGGIDPSLSIFGGLSLSGFIISPPQPVISLNRSGGTVIITYTGTLQAASTVDGAYSDVIGANSPYPVPTASAQMQFYRSRQ